MSAALARKPLEESPASKPEAGARRVSGEVPRIAFNGFAETAATRAAFEAFAADRRMSRTSSELFSGGVAEAAARYRGSPSPDLLVVETTLPPAELTLELDRLAEVCGRNTRVVIVGHANDIALYRTLIAAGVEDYLVAPVDPLALVEIASRLFCGASAAALGRVYAFIGAKGGVGSSIVAQNAAWALAGRGRDVLLADLDLSFGCAALNCDVEAGRGLAEAVREIERLDAALLERLAIRRGRHLCVLGSTGALEGPGDLEEDAVRRLIEVAAREFPFVILDLPHLWTGWVRTALRGADSVVVTATPSLAALRNAAGLLDALKALRPNDAAPHLVLNQTGAGGREPRPAEIEATLKLKPACRLAFEPKVFADANAKGAMIEEVRRGRGARRQIEALAAALAGEAKEKTTAGGWRRLRLRGG